MARPRKIVATVEDIDAAFELSSEPFEAVEETTEEVAEVVPTERDVQVEALMKLFPKAAFETYDDDLVHALYKQHIGITVRPE